MNPKNIKQFVNTAKSKNMTERGSEKIGHYNFTIFVLDVLNRGLFRMIVNLFILADLDNPLTTDT